VNGSGLKMSLRYDDRPAASSHPWCTPFIASVHQAAKAGDTGSMVRLAKLHLAGAGCAKDLNAAKYWVRRAR
jgi:TPR repeat protein